MSPEERAQVIGLMNCPDYQDLSPNQIVPRLADEGVLAAE